MIEGRDGKDKALKLRYGMIGGGPGSFIGEVHRKAIAMDGKAELVCGCFSQDYEKTLAAGAGLGLPKDRLYRSAGEMLKSEAARPDRPDFIVVVTPNSGHFPASKLALENGFHVVCEKPLTTTGRDAAELKRLAGAKGLMFCVTYAYSASPMVKQARDLIASGELGDILFVNGEYPQEWLITPLEKEGQKQAMWRTDPTLAGASNCVGDIGSHIEQMVGYLTGLRITRLCARLDKLGPGRVLDDNATIMLEFDNGAKGVYWTSQVAIGHDNAFRVRIYGTKGALEWVQEDPNHLKVSFLGKPNAVLSRGRDPISRRAAMLSRIPSGHPEGYFESFANLYTTFITALAKKLDGMTPTIDDLDFPGLEDGIRGVRFIEKCVESSKRGAAWVDMDQKGE